MVDLVLAGDALGEGAPAEAFNFFMQCPQCQTEISDRDPKCKNCGFDVLAMDKVLSACPTLQGHVNDFANVLSAHEIEKLKTLLEGYKQQSGHDVVVVTVKTTKPLTPAQYVFWLYNEWGVGGKSHQGVMILLALEERRVETEVGFGLEHIITDDKSGKILDQSTVGYLKSEKYDEGLCAGTKAIIEALEKSTGNMS